ncbi:MAG: serine hydrolase [Micromonosporaceae bacterium]
MRLSTPATTSRSHLIRRFTTRRYVGLHRATASNGQPGQPGLAWPVGERRYIALPHGATERRATHKAATDKGATHKGLARRGKGISLWRGGKGVGIAAAVAGVVAAAVVAPLLTAPVQAHPGLPSAVFDPPSVSWASIRDYSSAAYGSALTSYQSKGFIPVDIEITTDAGYRAGAAFQKNLDNRQWRVHRDLTGTQYSNAWSAAKADGFRVADQESYLLGGTRRWAGLFVKNTESYSWASYRGLTDTELHDKTIAHRDAGRMPVDIDTYLVSGRAQHDVVFVRNAEGLKWQLRVNLTSAGFSQDFATFSDAGYRMLGFDSYQASSGQRYDGLWVQNANGRQWRERRDLTASQYANWWHRYSDEGFRVIGSYRYQTANGTRYAMILRQNSDRPTWSLKSQVDNRIQTEMTTYNVPGMSVAVIQNGQFRYLRGFGHADVGDNVWLDSGHVQRLASVSKAVGGTLTMDMVEAGLLELTDTSRSLVPQMPDHHTHTVGQLASNRSCVRHYGEGTNGATNPPYETALEAAEDIWDDPLVCPVGTWHYSTHGYTILGADLEAAGGASVNTLLANRITTPLGLSTMRTEDQSDTSVRRTSFYATDNTEITPGDISWKVLGGGLESSVADLARFGYKVADGQLLGTDALDTLWTKPDNQKNYAYGWNVGTENGHRVVAKDGNTTGSRAYLRVYPDDGIAIAVMSNRNGGGHSASAVATYIGSLMI